MQDTQYVHNMRQKTVVGASMGCGIATITQWESESQIPDADALNQLSYLRNYVDASSDQTARRPMVEKEMEARALAQLTHRDLLKDIQ